jgi:hypothetical protein
MPLLLNWRDGEYRVSDPYTDLVELFCTSGVIDGNCTKAKWPRSGAPPTMRHPTFDNSAAPPLRGFCISAQSVDQTNSIILSADLRKPSPYITAQHQ